MGTDSPKPIILEVPIDTSPYKIKAASAPEAGVFAVKDITEGMRITAEEPCVLALLSSASNRL